MILILDNYDSFTYNLVQYVGSINTNIKVIKNNELTVEKIKAMNISHIIISPGPGNQFNTGVAMKLIKSLSYKVPTLGICLGHQTIAHCFNAKIIRSKNIMHGKTSIITHNQNSVLYKRIPVKFQATRYHSLSVDRKYSNKDLKITSKSDDGEIMSIEHNKLPIYGIQYHPEAVLTEHGLQIMKNFLNIVV